MDNFGTQFAIAEGFVLLGMLVDAWDTLEELPASCRALPEALKVRLMICTRLDHWEMGKEIAGVINPEHDYEVREAAGRFHLDHAIALCAAGNVPEARAALTRLAVAWPEGRALVMDSEGLKEVW
ncbi:MAG: hypothetical protein V4675_19200 [Verrucomicrobiota bacterium]